MSTDSATTVQVMNTLTNGIFTIINGSAALLNYALKPTSLMLLVCALSLMWLALIEVDEVDRQGTKPVVGRGR